MAYPNVNTGDARQGRSDASDRTGTMNGARADGAHTGPVGEATFAELIGRLINDLSDLLDRQITLAKQEVRDQIGEALGSVKTMAIGAGIAATAGLLLLITAWTAIIWFFNWLGNIISTALGNPFWAVWLGSLGWLLGFIIPALAGWIAWKRFIKPGFGRVRHIRPMERTRETLKEDLEWAKGLRTPNAK